MEPNKSTNFQADKQEIDKLKKKLMDLRFAKALNLNSEAPSNQAHSLKTEIAKLWTKINAKPRNNTKK